MLRAPPGLALLLLLMAGLACAATHTTTHTTLSTKYSNQKSHPQQQQQHISPNKSSSSSSSSSTALRFPRNASARQSALEVLNPWLSACDLQPASATDLSPDTCTTAPEAAMWTTTQCPPPCPTVFTTIASTASSSARARGGVSASSSTTSAPNRPQQQQQCLVYLEDTHKDEVCDPPVGVNDSPAEVRVKRRKKLEQFRLRHCCERTVDSALPDVMLYGLDDGTARPSVTEDTRMCRQSVGALLEVDALAARVSCEFAEVLARYDCGQRYSINHHCEDCKEAYRKWVCSSLVPHFTAEGRRIRPCLSICQLVEERCPYMLPGDRAPAHPTQYAGQPTFLCLDQNIPETGEQRTKSSQGPADCCYNHCGSPGRGNALATNSQPPENICVHCPAGPDQSPPTDHLPDTITCPATVTVNTTCGGQRSSVTSTSTSTALATTSAGRSCCAPSIALLLFVVLLFADVLDLLAALLCRVSVARGRVCVLRVRTRDNYYDYHDGVWVSNGGHAPLLLDSNTNDFFLYNWTSCL